MTQVDGNDGSAVEITGPSLAAEVRDPPVDVLVGDDAACIRLAAPGSRSDDLRVEVHGRSVVVFGMRSCPAVPGGLRFVVAEIGIGPFRRRIDLPWEPNPGRITTSVELGIVEIHVVPRRRPAPLSRREGGDKP
jgi:HSP20 family molecular chaperone IbpA